jgi:hypothetical protein
MRLLPTEVSGPIASAVVSTVQPGSGSRPMRIDLPVSSSRASRRAARVVRAVCAALAAVSSKGVRQASGSVEMLPSAVSSGRRTARRRARSVVWARRSGSVQSGL